jgi:hypothetical protein
MRGRPERQLEPLGVVAPAFEEKYGRLGRTRGPDAIRDARSGLREWWTSQEASGVRWLVARIRDEIHWDVLDAVVSILAVSGEGAAPVVLDALEDDRHEVDGRLALLKALREIPLGAESIERARDVALRARADRDSDVREAADELLDRIKAESVRTPDRRSWV